MANEKWTETETIAQASTWLHNAKDKLIERLMEPAHYDVNGFTGDTIYDNLRVGRGYPPVNALNNRGRTVGVCIDPAASDNNQTEVFVSPFLSDTFQVLYTLLHELGHAAVGNGKDGGHGPRFADYCRAVGLVGPDPANPYAPNWTLMTVCQPGTALAQTLADIEAEIGPYPYASINLTKVTRPAKAATRLLKEFCDNRLCPYHVATGKVNTARATWSIIRDAGCHTCTACGQIMVVVLARGQVGGGQSGGPIDPDAPPTIVDGFGSGKSEPIPPNVRITTEDKNRGNKTDKPTETESPAETNSDTELEEDGPSDEEMDEEYGPSDEELEREGDAEYGNSAPGGTEGGSGPGKAASVEAHAIDPYCSCNVCTTAMTSLGESI